MRGRKDPQATMLAFVDVEARVPLNYPLRSIKTEFDQALAALSPEFDQALAALSPEFDQALAALSPEFDQALAALSPEFDQALAALSPEFDQALAALSPEFDQALAALSPEFDQALAALSPEFDQALAALSPEFDQALAALSPEFDQALAALSPEFDQALAALSPEFDQMYSVVGRPSIPPERVLKSSVLIALYSVRSERAFCEQLDYNLLFRWFLDMNLMEPSFDPTVFTKNRKRLLEHRVGHALFDEVVMAADRLGLLSDEHFTVDGTLIEAAASLKSFKPRDGDPPSTTDADGGNPSVDFHGKRRSNTTHQSTTDPESRLLRKGKGKEARLVFMAHAMMENRNGMLTDFQRARSRVRRSAMRCRCSWTRRENEAFTPRPWAGTRTTTPVSALLRCGSVESHPTWHRTRRVDRVPLTVGPLGMLGMPLASGRASGWKRSSDG